MTASTPGHWRSRLLTFQALYYVVTGLWPLVHLGSFEAVTGPKVDDWLVHMVGLLAAAIGASLGISVFRGKIDDTVAVSLAILSAFAFAAIDLWYGLSGRIPPIYLVDAAVQAALIISLISTGQRRPRQ